MRVPSVRDKTRRGGEGGSERQNNYNSVSVSVSGNAERKGRVQCRCRQKETENVSFCPRSRWRTTARIEYRRRCGRIWKREKEWWSRLFHPRLPNPDPKSHRRDTDLCLVLWTHLVMTDSPLVQIQNNVDVSETYAMYVCMYTRRSRSSV